MKQCDTCKLKEVTEIAKKGIDAYEYCIKELEKRDAQYRSALEDIREAVKNNLNAGILISGGWIEQKIDEVLNPHN